MRKASGFATTRFIRINFRRRRLGSVEVVAVAAAAAAVRVPDRASDSSIVACRRSGTVVGFRPQGRERGDIHARKTFRHHSGLVVGIALLSAQARRTLDIYVVDVEVETRRYSSHRQANRFSSTPATAVRRRPGMRDASWKRSRTRASRRSTITSPRTGTAIISAPSKILRSRFRSGPTTIMGRRCSHSRHRRSSSTRSIRRLSPSRSASS